jgi:hypothetical protein
MLILYYFPDRITGGALRRSWGEPSRQRPLSGDLDNSGWFAEGEPEEVFVVGVEAEQLEAGLLK